MTKESVTKRRKAWCSVGISVAALLMIFSFCGRYFKSGLRSVANFFVGSFGIAFYGMMIAVIVCCSFMLAGKTIRIPKKYVAHFCLLFAEIVLLVHMFTTIYFCYDGGQFVIPFDAYAATVYDHYTIPTFGGIVFGIITFGLQKVITIYATAVLLFGLLAWSVVSIGIFFNSYFTGKLNLDKTTKKDVQPVVSPEVAEAVPEIDDDRARAIKILFQNQEQTIAPESSTQVYGVAQQSRLDQHHRPSTPEEAQQILFGKRPDTYYGSGVSTEDTNVTDDEINVKGYFNPSEQPAPPKAEEDSWKISQPATEQPRPQPAAQSPAPAFEPADDGWITPQDYSRTSVDVTDVVVEDEEEQPFVVQQPVAQPAPQQPVQQQPVVQPAPQQPAPAAPVYQPDEQQGVRVIYEDFDIPEGTFDEPFVEDVDVEEEPAEQPFVEPQPQPAPAPAYVQQPESQQVNIFDADPSDDLPSVEDRGNDEYIPVPIETKVQGGVQMGIDFRTKQEIEEAKNKVHKYQKYSAPPTDLLNDAVIVEDDGEYERNMAAAAIVNKLAVFGIRIEPAGQVVGPSVTRYMFKVLSQKTRMSDFAPYAQDLKACLEASGEIRIEAPIHGTNLVGIEVANKKRTPVMLRTVLESKEYKEKKGNLVFVVGQQISGEMVVDDLSKLPHLLVAGTTGSGKSVFLHSLIVSLMYRYGPEYLRFIMVDPKLVEFGRYNGIPHMLTTETITNATDALAAMDYLVAEMESRYQLLRQNNVANIADYNAKINPKLVQRLPYLVLVVDELADLMSVQKKAFEAKLQRLAQKARAAGIHLVLATQRPDVQVISGTIKTNFPCRIALKVSSATDSGTILNGGGAEKLLGYGDLLYMHPSRSDLQRIQGTYLSDEEITSLVTYVTTANESYYDPSISKEIFVSQQTEEAEPEVVEHADAKEEIDPYCKRALRFWLERQGGRASIASIQRSLKVGFNRAGRIMDTLQKLHYVETLAPSETSSKPLKVLVTLEQLDDLFPDQDDEY